MQFSAVLSSCGAYRYRLGRRWGEGAPCVWICLNPSTAGATVDDATIRKLIGFTRRLGRNALEVVNLFALRATDPCVLYRDPEIAVGPDNDQHIRAAVSEPGALVYRAWGAPGFLPAHLLPWFRERVEAVEEILRQAGVEARALALTKDGRPRHPLYVRYDVVEGVKQTSLFEE